MAYKKYIEKNGKIYGPYVYHSKRVNGKVVSEYRGIKKKEKKIRKKLIITLGTILFLFIIFWVIFFSIQFSGRVILNIEDAYKEGEYIGGKINLELKAGELLPQDSKIIIENSNNLYEFNLSDLIEEDTISGNYYIECADLTDTGEGYGLIGKKELTPTVFFEIEIYPEETTSSPEEEAGQTIEENTTETISENTTEENTPTETTTEETTEETVSPEEETIPTITGEVTQGTISSVSNFFKNILTGRVIEDKTQGDVSKNNPKEYNIPENSKVEIVLGSVRTEEKELSEEIINLDIEGQNLIVSTNYSEIEEGFGKEFIGEEEKIISIDLNKLNAPLQEGEVTIRIISQNKEIYSAQETISSGEEQTETEPLENLTNITEPIEDLINETIEEENISLEKITEENLTISLSFEKINLTEEEKNLIKNNVPFPVVETQVNEYKDKFNVIFTIGEHTMEHHYNLELNETELKNQIDRDRIIWLKDLANKFSEKITPTERRIDLDENYAIM